MAPPYSEMVLAAVTELKDRTGSSRQAIAKYLTDNYELAPRYEVHMKLALKRLVETKVLVQTKGTGATGSFSLNKKKAKKTSRKNLDDDASDGDIGDIGVGESGESGAGESGESSADVMVAQATANDKTTTKRDTKVQFKENVSASSGEDTASDQSDQELRARGPDAKIKGKDEVKVKKTTKKAAGKAPKKTTAVKKTTTKKAAEKETTAVVKKTMKKAAEKETTAAKKTTKKAAEKTPKETTAAKKARK